MADENPAENVFSSNPDFVKSLGGIISCSPSGVTKLIEMARGSEGHVCIKITNKLSEDIYIHFEGGSDTEKREMLESGMTRVFPKKPSDGLLGKTNYTCKFWIRENYSKVHVYGKKAARADNKFEVRDKGLYLIEEHNKEYHVSKLDKDETVDQD